MSAGISNPQQEALWLAEYALGVNSAGVLARQGFTPSEAAKIEAVILRRETGEPLQYITGEADFFGRDFRVGEGVLVPRHDTETLIYAALKHFARDEEFAFLDFGTGTGCIAVTLLLEFPRARAFLAEVSADARRFAAVNLDRYGVAGRAEFVDTWPACEVVVSNPPYIPSGEISGLVAGVRDYEPVCALDGGADGMNFYREIFARAESECIILEMGNMQQVRELKSSCGRYIFCDTVKDDGGFPRCLVFRRRRGHEEACG